MSLYNSYHKQLLFSPNFGLPITWYRLILVGTGTYRLRLCSRTLVAHLCTSLQIPIWPSDSYYWWVVCILWYGLCISALFRQWIVISSHPCTVEVIGHGTCWYFWRFLHSSHNFFAINFCCFPQPTYLKSVAQFTSSFSFSEHSILLCLLCTMFVPWLWPIFFFSAAKWLAFLTDSSLVFMLVCCL